MFSSHTFVSALSAEIAKSTPNAANLEGAVGIRAPFENGKFRDFPNNRWSLSHMRELVATVNIWRGNGQPSHLTRDDRSAAIDQIMLTAPDGSRYTFEQVLWMTCTDALIVLHKGHIIYEKYFPTLMPHQPHSLMSITKSYIGILAASFTHSGTLDEGKRISYYLPELKNSAWADATLRDVMDMRTGLAFEEVYSSPETDGWAYERAGGWRPWPVGVKCRPPMQGYLASITKQGEHGGAFAYKSPNASILAWVIERVTGKSLPNLIQEYFWIPLGCEENADMVVDSAGIAMAGGGLCATLRDVARFGELVRNQGDWHGKPLIPAAVIEDVQFGGRDNPVAHRYRSKHSYRNMWWITNDEYGAFEGLGAEGQHLYIAPKSEMVAVRFASQPRSLSGECGFFSSLQMQSLAGFVLD